MESLEKLLADFKQARADHAKMMESAPRIIGVESVRIIHQNFALQGYDSGNGVEKWQPRKVSTNMAYGGTFTHGVSRVTSTKRAKQYKGSVFNAANPILIQTRNLYNSIQYKIAGGYVFVGVNLSIVPYAKAHNLGLHHEPKRKFMPDTSEGINPKMIKAVQRKLKFETDGIMKRFKL